MRSGIRRLRRRRARRVRADLRAGPAKTRSRPADGTGGRHSHTQRLMKLCNVRMQTSAAAKEFEPSASSILPSFRLRAVHLSSEFRQRCHILVIHHHTSIHSRAHYSNPSILALSGFSPFTSFPPAAAPLSPPAGAAVGPDENDAPPGEPIVPGGGKKPGGGAMPGGGRKPVPTRMADDISGARYVEDASCAPGGGPPFMPIGGCP